MDTHWRQSDVFPVVAEAITRLYSRDPGEFVTHDEIVRELLSDPAGSALVEEARRTQQDPKSLEWTAHNMVAWFSQRITIGDSDYSATFDRKQIDGKWAYKPATDH